MKLATINVIGFCILYFGWEVDTEKLGFFQVYFVGVIGTIVLQLPFIFSGKKKEPASPPGVHQTHAFFADGDRRAFGIIHSPVPVEVGQVHDVSGKHWTCTWVNVNGAGLVMANFIPLETEAD